jgi:Ring finger domain
MPAHLQQTGLQILTMRRTISSRAATGRSSVPASNTPSAIYIYPGLLRVQRQKALHLDAQCPASIYTCHECTKPGLCSHSDGCSICLEEFHSLDLIRSLPCSSKHTFHTRCILTWFTASDCCPLCKIRVCGTITAKHDVRNRSRQTSVHLVPRPTMTSRQLLASQVPRPIATSPQTVFSSQDRASRREFPARAVNIAQDSVSPAVQYSIEITAASQLTAVPDPPEILRDDEVTSPCVLSVADEQIRLDAAQRRRAQGSEASNSRPLTKRSADISKRTYSSICHDNVRMCMSNLW